MLSLFRTPTKTASRRRRAAILLGLWVTFALVIAPFACNEAVAASRSLNHSMVSDSGLTAKPLGPGEFVSCHNLKGHCPEGIGPGGIVPQGLVSSPAPHAAVLANLAAVLSPQLPTRGANSLPAMTELSMNVRNATGRLSQLRFLVTSPRLRN